VYALADSDSLQKILSNLYSNAVKYSDKSVKTSLVYLESENQFKIEIRNDGFLIPSEIKDKIFEPFFRIKETNHHKGTGIGLAISRALTELHKGTLELKKPEGRFNVFALTLPANITNESEHTTPAFEHKVENFNLWNP
jgi:signal transduction histidine kinase